MKTKQIAFYELKFLRVEAMEPDPKKPDQKEKFKLFFACAERGTLRGAGVTISIEQMEALGGNWTIKVDADRLRKLRGVLQQGHYYRVMATSSAMNGDNGREPIVYHDEIIDIEPIAMAAAA